MKSLLRLVFLAPALLAAAPDAGSSPAPAAPPAAAPASPADLPKPIQSMLDEKGDDGQPVLSPADRDAILKFPPHIIQLIADRADQGTLFSAKHLKALLALNLNPQSAELVFSDNCLVCHTSSEVQSSKQLFSADPKATHSPEHLNIKEFLSDAHFRHGLSCSGCHGGSPEADMMPAAVKERWPAKDDREKNRQWVIDFCGRCHADPNFMRGYNPSLPTDQVAKYKDSQHGIQLLQKHDSKAATCVSCHGVHGIRGPKSPQSTVHPQRVPETCGHCHADAAYMAGYMKADGTPLPTNQLADYRQSVHGKDLLEKGDLGAPACNDCHGNHAAMPPEVASVAQVCRTCHAMNGTLFDGSKHKKAFEEHKWPECGQCHGKHGIAKTSDTMVSDSPTALCGGCHAKYAQDDPKCNEAARYFRATLDDLSASSKSIKGEIEHVAERGLDVEKLTSASGELDEALTQSRSRVHAFDPGEFDVAAKPGRQAQAKAEQLIAAAHDEYNFRRNGLLLAIGAMAFLAAMLGLKIRELNGRRRGAPPPPDGKK